MTNLLTLHYLARIPGSTADSGHGNLRRMTKFGVDNYDDYWRMRKAQGRTRFSAVHGKIVEVIKRYVAPGCQILDCGVGPAQSYRLLAQDYQLSGVEISSEAIAQYDFDVSRIKQANLNDGIPEFGVQFDGLIASMIIHHLRDPSAFLNQVKERLAPTGVLLAVHPNISYYKHRLKYLFRGTFPSISTAHVVFLPPHELRALLEAANFEIIKITSPKRTVRARLWPELFSQDLFYVCRARPAR